MPGTHSFGSSIAINDENYIIVGATKTFGMQTTFGASSGDDEGSGGSGDDDSEKGDTEEVLRDVDVAYFYAFSSWQRKWSAVKVLRPRTAQPNEIVAGVVSISNDYLALSSYDEVLEESKVNSFLFLLPFTILRGGGDEVKQVVTTSCMKTFV